MATFSYVGRDASGQSVTGNVDADNEGTARDRLREQGTFVQSVRPVKGAKTTAVAKGQQTGVAVAKKEKKKFTFGGKVKLVDLSVFCRQFSTMIDAGVSLVRCLSVLQEQCPNPTLKRILTDIQVEVESGNTLSRAMTKYPRVFSPLFVGLIKAGEVGGVLEESLQRLSSFLEKDMETRRKVKSAMTYPTIVIFAAFVIVIGLTTFVLPSFFQVFKDLGLKDDQLPGPTQFLMNFSALLRGGFPTRQIILVVCLIAFIAGFKSFTRTKVGRRIYDRFKLKIPVFGNLNHKVALSRFARTLSTLLVSGVPILQALETVAGTVDNVIIGDAILDARTSIREGERIGDPLQKSGQFPPMVVQMISIGEESGALDAMLTKIAEFYEDEVDAALSSLTAAIEPVLMVFLGVIVGFIVVSVFLPMTSIISQMSGGGGDKGDGE
ncbi:MAG TPA: type II secretion system F family protein [Armatimonadota bacterium]|jgi:type IV pilus assembly protein PilC